MPHRKSALKRMRSDERKRARNFGVKSALRTSIKKAEQAISSGDVEQARVAVREASQKLDKAAQKGVMKKNTAGRKKSRLAKNFNKTQAA